MVVSRGQAGFGCRLSTSAKFVPPESQHGRSFSLAFCLGLVQNEDRG